MSDVAAQLSAHERRIQQHDDDIRFLYRDVRWVRRAVTRMMTHFGIEPPGDEEE